MNPFALDATGLMVWGLVAHLIADWPLQNDWMARNKASLRHPAGYVHAGIHGALLALVFGCGAVPLAVVHLLIDTRVPVVWWSRLVRQTQPEGGPAGWLVVDYRERNDLPVGAPGAERRGLIRVVRPMLVDVGTEVRFWTDQVFHIATIAAAALIVGALS